jgi:GNAT superfamily N-acetyltransferase
VCERAGAVDVEAFRDVYLRVYAEPPYHEDEAAADRFAGQLREHVALPGFSATTVTDDDGVLGGFAYGVAYDDGWWHPRATAPPPAWVGHPLYYVWELLLAPELRGRGHGRGLLDLLLADRGEPCAVLAASTGAPAYRMYLRWGWTKIGGLAAPPAGVDLLARRLDATP